MMVWNDTLCLRLLWPFRLIAAHPSPAARRRCASTPPGKPAGNTATKGGMWPVRRMLDQTVLHRIEMNVVQMRREVPIVADRVLSVSSLPDAAFAPADHDR